MHPHPLRQIQIVVLAAFAVLVAGCAGLNPLASAETPAQKAYAISASYNIVLESAAEIVEDPTAPIELRRTIQRTEARTTPIVDELEDAFVELTTIRAEYRAGATTEERLQLAVDNLEAWVDRAEAALVDLATAVKGE